MMAQEKKNGELLCGHHVILGVAEIAPLTPLPTMLCIDHKVWYEDYLRGENLLIEEDEAIEEAEAVEGLDDYVEEVSVRKKTLFISNLAVKCKIQQILTFFQDVELSVRLIVDYKSKLVGCGFVEFASAIEAKKVLKMKNRVRGMTGRLIILGVAKMAQYPVRPKYDLAEKLWCECYLPRESLWIEEEYKEFCGKKITFSYDDD
ncbi:unnamed protein product [Cuscuta campestris]|uniref:RRM domain-containing protein n=1 Tax=Cuscuta campestris TaxID=132261 RepID=A0A484MKI1_9ASTE|nr:unnamed protein product [Cuscuta campestris]